MRYPASEKAEIIRLVETSRQSAQRTFATLRIPKATVFRWYDLYRRGEQKDRVPPGGVADKKSHRDVRLGHA